MDTTCCYRLHQPSARAAKEKQGALSGCLVGVYLVTLHVVLLLVIVPAIDSLPASGLTPRFYAYHHMLHHLTYFFEKTAKYT